MSKSIFYYKQLTATEVGSKGTHEIYVRLPNDFDHNDFFQEELDENDKVLEKNFIAHNLTNGHEGEDVELRFVYFHNSNKEKRIPSLGELFKANNVQENDVVRLESRIDNGEAQFYITFLRANEINLSPKQFYFSVINDDDLLKKSSPSCKIDHPLQQIYYGAPGTGKSHIIKEQTKGKNVIRTTFHPDSDYSTFVGAYKPTTKEITLRDLSGHVVVENGQPVKEEKIIYEFVSQAFLQSYVNAWKAYAEAQLGEASTEQYLVIEEINRGNCAQIFGDLFQLLDRNDSGFSDYPIKADNDMKKQLAKAFKGIDVPQRDAINALYDEDDIVSKVLDGEVLLLPNNLYIWATMNTSDQSLFPIDSAFKRRWDWKYMPINNTDMKWRIAVNGAEYDWWQFLTKVNEYIGSTTNSEDKKLGYFFCKAKDEKFISAETFVSKVIFYLWNDVFKDYGFDGTLFQAADGSTLTFDKFYGDNAMAVNEDNVAEFLKNLGVEAIETTDGVNDESADKGPSDDDNIKSKMIVTFEDGTSIQEPKYFDTYLQTLKHIGLEQCESVASEGKYKRKGAPLISKEQYPSILEPNSTYSYVQDGEYYIVKGMKNPTKVQFLRHLSEKLGVKLTINYT